MSNRPSLAEALKPHDRAAASAVVVESRHNRIKETPVPPSRAAKTPVPPSRAGKKALIGYFDPDVSKQLKQMMLDHDRNSVQELLREAINDLFQKYSKPPIA